jgi:hypothetical protein
MHLGEAYSLVWEYFGRPGFCQLACDYDIMSSWGWTALLLVGLAP